MPKKINTLNKPKILIIFTLLFLVFFITPHVASAITLNIDYPSIPYPGGSISLNCIETGECTITVGNILIYIYIASIWIGGIIAVLTLFYVGFTFIYSGNNPGARAKAKKRFQDVLIGLAILFTAVIVLNIINPDITNLRESGLSNITDPDPSFGFGELGAPKIGDESLPKLLEKCVESGKSEDQCKDELAKSLTESCKASGGSADACYTSCWSDLSKAITNAFGDSFLVSEPEAKALCDKYKIELTVCRNLKEGCSVVSDACCEGLSCEEFAPGSGAGLCAEKPTEPFTLAQQDNLLNACAFSGGVDISKCTFNAVTNRYDCPDFKYNADGTRITCNNVSLLPFDTGKWCGSCEANTGIYSECYFYGKTNNAGCCGKTAGLC